MCSITDAANSCVSLVVSVDGAFNPFPARDLIFVEVSGAVFTAFLAAFFAVIKSPNFRGITASLVAD